jgi:hypothetical protein
MSISGKIPGAASPRNERTAPEESPLASAGAGLVIVLIGLAIFMIGVKPEWFGLSRSSGVGFIKISVFLSGLAVICVGGLIGLLALWKGMQRTITSDIGVRLVSTGYVISAFSGMADVFGFGSQPPPRTPFFGPLQSTGVVIGQVIIAIGFLMIIPYHSPPVKK